MEINKNNNYVVIMAGGVGTRLWPISRKKKPKQFSDILNIGKTLIQLAFERALNIVPQDNIFIVTNEEYEDIIVEQISISKDNLLLEPEGRDTAPCIAFASYKIKAKNKHANLLITPADHVIFDEHLFFDVINMGLEYCTHSDDLITIGISPHKPETEYGYIQFESSDDDQIKKVKTFTEKPNYKLAEKFFESGEYLWNAGIFIWNVNSIIMAFEKYVPDLAEDFEKGHNLWYSKKERMFLGDLYSKCNKISIDYAVLEKAQNVKVICGCFSWSDLGSWNAIHDAYEEKDDDNNSLIGDVVQYNTKNSYIRSFCKDKLVMVDGLSNYLVVDDNHVLLVCPKNDSKRFRKYVEDLKNNKKGREKHI